ncbi:MAG: DUF5053 domain-containing protein [Prevotellaceae bacterium]|jgi:hypothetical protein|nr:DUF5053 domain-containing protein [Prevotellaceae bacterium]
MDVKKLMDEMHNAQSESEEDAIVEKIRQEFESLSPEGKAAAKATFSVLLDEVIERAKATLKEMDLAIEVAEISKYVSLSAIAKSYFGKSKEWLYQRIKHYNVNGKPARFNADEQQTFSQALKDISQMAYQASLRIS